MRRRSPVLVLLAAAAGAAAPAYAAPRLVGTQLHAEGGGYAVSAVVTEDATLAGVRVRVTSDAGEETVRLAETDAWLHGAATLRALPATDAALALTLYDLDGAPLATLAGRLAADGTMALGDAACAARGCADAPDVEVRAAETFAADSGYALAFDLAGADVAAIAYADVTVVTSASTCTSRVCDGGSSESASTRAEVDWAEVGTVWEGALASAPSGMVEVHAKVYDRAGEVVVSEKAKLGLAIADGGAGVGTLASDEDPLTRLAYTPPVFSCDRVLGCGVRPGKIVAVSEGWTELDALPTELALAVAGGETVAVPVNSWQRAQRRKQYLASLRTDSEMSGPPSTPVTDDRTVDIEGTATALYGVTVAELATPVCSGATCVVVTADETGAYAISVTAYGPDAAALPDGEDLVVTVYDAAGAPVAREAVRVDFEDEYAAVFANEVTLAGDPVGLGLSGKASLLGAASRKGKQATLAKGTFAGWWSRDGDGELGLAGGAKDAVVSAGAAVVFGAAVGLESTDGAGDATFDAPPVLVYGNGSGTKAASSQASTKPQLL